MHAHTYTHTNTHIHTHAGTILGSVSIFLKWEHVLHIFLMVFPCRGAQWVYFHSHFLLAILFSYRCSSKLFQVFSPKTGRKGTSFCSSSPVYNNLEEWQVYRLVNHLAPGPQNGNSKAQIGRSLHS